MRCKQDVTDLERLVSLICIRPFERSLLLLAIMDIRTHPISFASRPLEGRMCHQITDATVRPFSPSPQSNSQTSAGIPVLVNCGLFNYAATDAMREIGRASCRERVLRLV